MTVAQLTPGEIARYLRGAELREEKKQREANSGQRTGVSENQREREQAALAKYE